ncbi:MAG: RDD family protein [Opitutales bacterium]|nr:RDD family protein [Opitutales bacterium]
MSVRTHVANSSTPPPLPRPPAGFGWRSLACLADIIPLIILGLFLAGQVANTEELAARERTDAFYNKIKNQYAKAIQNPSVEEQNKLMQMAEHPDEKDMEAVAIALTQMGEVCFLVTWLGLALQEIFLGGQTLGKRMFSLKVVDFYTQESAGVLSCLLRSAWKAAFINLFNPFTSILGIINFHVPLFRKDRRAWHDMFTRSYVIDLRKR